MKLLDLKTPSFQYLEHAFAQWLDILGYSGGVVYNMPAHVRAFLHYLENKGVKHITQLEHRHYKSFFDHLCTRANQRRGGGLSNNHINKHLQALDKFLEFLHHKGTNDLPALSVKLLKLEKHPVTVLTAEEIQQLYAATHKEPGPATSVARQEALNARDRAMLTMYYGCGLRRNEGANLRVDDLNFDTRVLHVRKGKNYKERFVPFGKASAKHLQDYVYDHRPRLLKDSHQNALFIGVYGKPMLGGALYTRLQQLIALTENPDLQQKEIGLHTLRHSIATHLLDAGMSLQKIQRFLGHSSLESTQIYTHLVNKNGTEL